MAWYYTIFGRFHPLVVHFPVGILLLAFIFEVVSLLPRYRHYRASVPEMLAVGAFFSVLSAATGLVLQDEGGYSQNLVQVHQILGISTACLSIITLILYKRLAKEKLFANSISIGIVALFVSITGHWGGMLTHGESYFSQADDDGEYVTDPVVKLSAIANVDSARLYADVIQPILESRCYSCHSSRRIKGDLRLDGIEQIMQGGSDGKVIMAGHPDSSSLYSRMMLPLEHEDHMPPNEKPQPSSAEVALIQSWIQDGADFERKVYQSKNTGGIKTFLSSLVAQSESPSFVPSTEVEPADEKAVKKITDRGIKVLLVASESNYVIISFVNKNNITTDDVRSLIPLRKQIIELDLARTNANDSIMSLISDLRELRKLNLQNTAITDAALSYISTLENLVHLNIVATGVTDAGLVNLHPLKNLTHIYAFQTDVSASGIDQLKISRPGIVVDTGGYSLPRIAEDTIDVFADP